jgi:hypothetical protein
MILSLVPAVVLGAVGIILGLFNWQLFLFLLSANLIAAVQNNIARVVALQRAIIIDLPLWFNQTAGAVFMG